MLTILTMITLVAAVLWGSLTLRLLRERDVKYIRGIVKFLSEDQFTDDDKKVITQWLLASAVTSVVPCLWVVYLCWANDYSFMIGLFPILWYYFLTRYLLWEKQDLL